MASTGHMANSTRFEARAKAGIELGWRAKRTTPIVSSLDLDLCSFFLKLATGPAVVSGRTMYYHSVCVKSPRDIKKSSQTAENPPTECSQ